jgi:hypothetical protein
VATEIGRSLLSLITSLGSSHFCVYFVFLVSFLLVHLAVVLVSVDELYCASLTVLFCTWTDRDVTLILEVVEYWFRVDDLPFMCQLFVREASGSVGGRFLSFFCQSQCGGCLCCLLRCPLPVIICHMESIIGLISTRYVPVARLQYPPGLTIIAYIQNQSTLLY